MTHNVVYTKERGNMNANEVLGCKLEQYLDT